MDRLSIMHADLIDLSSLIRVVESVQPDHVYNLAAQSSVSLSWSQPLLTSEVTGMGCARMLEAIRIVKPDARFYQASSSEMFGISNQAEQDETTPFQPRSPYGAAKAFAHNMTVNYRESYGIFAVAGILFNHESERRGIEFVTRKIAAAVARIDQGDSQPLALGDLSSRRDWGFAPDYTKAMTAMLEQTNPEDFVVATGVSWTVQDFVERAFSCVGRDWKNHVVQTPDLLRPADIPVLCGNATKARHQLGWAPSLDFDQLVERMVRSEIKRRRTR